MKKLTCVLLSLVLTAGLALPAAAAGAEPCPEPQDELILISPIPDRSPAPEMPMVRRIVVNGEALGLLDLPVDFYREGEVTMVPLRRIGEALGLTVGWNGETGEITLEDSVQKVTLRDGSAQAVFTGKLKVIDLSREVECEAPVTVLEPGYTYVPLSLFEAFFQDVEETSYSVTITTHMYQLDEA